MNITEWENDVGPGWRPLIRELDTKLRAIDPDYKIEQVKEKFGGLRYYFSSSIGAIGAERRFPPSPEEQIGTGDQSRINEMNALARVAEAQSFRTCEDCGATEGVETRATNGFWLRTLCEPCRDTEVERLRQEP